MRHSLRCRGAFGRLRTLFLCLGALCLARKGWMAFVPAQIHESRSVGAAQVALVVSTISQAAKADDADGDTSWSFNPFVILVPAGVIYLLGWVFSLKPEMDTDADGYKSTTLRGRDSEENLKRRIAEMEAREALEEKQRQALIAGKATPTSGDDFDDDLFSSDLDAQLRAAQKNG